MMSLDFDYTLSNFNFLTIDDQNFFNTCLSESENNKRDPTYIIEKCWNSILDFFNKENPDYLNSVIPLKSDIIMSIYAILTYQTNSLIDNNTLVKAVTPKISQDKEYYRNTLYRYRKELQNIYGDRTNWNQYRKNTELLYFSPAWESLTEKKSYKVIDQQNFFYYITHHKKWPFHNDNKNGMLFCDLCQSLTEMCMETDHSYSLSADKALSFYLFEQLFSPYRFYNLLATYFKFFDSYFYLTDEPTREKAIILASVTSGLPVSLQNYYIEDYFTTIQTHLVSQNNEYEAIFSKYFSQIVFHLVYYVPFIQTVFLKLIWQTYIPSISNNTSEEIKLCLPSLKILFSEYINKNINNFNYEENINMALTNLKNMNYPLKSKGIGTPHKISNEIRNNVPIDSFNYNFTYNFYMNNNPFTYFDICNQHPHISPRDCYMNICQKYCIIVSNTTNIFTTNYMQQKNPHAVILTNLK